jgi:predicted phage terminase large subunit-like protein
MPTDPRAPASDLPLCPELKSYDFLLKQKSIMANAYWEALYQQNPITIGGNIIRGEWFKRYAMHAKILYRKIYADTAQKTKEANDYSVFECWGRGDDGKIYLLDMIRGKCEALELKRRAVSFWQKHKAMPPELGALREMAIEDKASGTGLIQDIKISESIPVKAIPRSTDKLTRIMDVVSYIEAGMVCIPQDAPFTNDFIAECEAFSADDSHHHDDQIDPMCDAINDMMGKKAKGFFDLSIGTQKGTTANV